MKQNIEIRDCERNEKEQNPKLKEGFFQALSEWPPPSVPRFGQLVQFFSDGKQPRFESQLRTKKSICAICNILNTSNLKTVSSSSYLRFGRNRLNLLTKDGLLANGQKFGQFSKETFFFLQETFKLRDFLQNFEQPIVDEIFSENWTRTSTIWQLDCKRTSADQRAAWSPAFTRSTVFEDINSSPLSSNILTWFLNWPL